MPSTYDYDVIIIGAGIGGLICGCYLAKAGMKVLIIEKNARPGGYCTSFVRKNFVFDSCVHAFGSCDPSEPFGQILNELNINIKIARANPSDVVITPDYEIKIYNDIDENLYQLATCFPKENKLKTFFSLLNKSGIQLFYSLKGKTFKELLDEYFINSKIKATFGIFLANCGISPSKASAFFGVLFLKSFVFNGGYYPIGGMQEFANSLVKSFLQYGGSIFYREEVKKIIFNGNNANEVLLNNRQQVSSDIIVSNVDARYTFLELIGRKNLNAQFVSELKKLSPTSSAFIVYLGLKEFKENPFEDTLGIWKMPDDYNIDKTLDLPLRNKISNDKFVFCSLPMRVDNKNRKNINNTMRLMVNAPFKEREYWDKNKNNYSDNLINRAHSILPDLKSHIILSESATPQTLYSYTNNYKGAMCGWLNTENQNNNVLLRNHKVKKLYLVGHWFPEKYGQGGIAMVAYSGKRAAKKILFDLDKK
jgi:phytoene dehydrogenase-like protein